MTAEKSSKSKTALLVRKKEEMNKAKRDRILKHISCLMGNREFVFHKDSLTRVIDGILNE